MPVDRDRFHPSSGYQLSSGSCAQNIPTRLPVAVAKASLSCLISERGAVGIGIAVRVGRMRHVARLMSRLTAGSAAVRFSRSLGCCSLLPTTGARLPSYSEVIAQPTASWPS